MARKRKLWSSLSREYRDRATAVARDYNLSRRQARERYNRGTFTPFARDKVPFKTADRFIPKPRVVEDESRLKPPGDFDNDKQRRVYRRIMSWFPNDGYYLVNGKRFYKSPPYRELLAPSYHSSQGVSWHPANPLTVWASCHVFSDRELDAILSMSRLDFQNVASNQNLRYNPFWYH